MTDKFELAVNTLLLRRLQNNLFQIDQNVAIDNSYITCAEYQLFIDEKLKAGEHRQPDHWTSYRFPPGYAKKPVTGVRASDAEEFCKWLTQHDSALGFKYRLPTLTEVQNCPVEVENDPVNGTQIGCWCKNGENKVIAGIEYSQWQVWQDQVWVNNLAHVDNHTPAYARSSARAINFNSIFDGDLASVLSSNFTFAEDLTSALNFAYVLTLARIVISGGIHICDLVVDFLRASVGNLVNILFARLVRDEQRMRDLVHSLGYDLVRTIANDRRLARQSDLNLARVLAHTRVLVRDRVRVRAHDLDLACDLARDRDLTFARNLTLTPIRSYLLLICVLWCWLSDVYEKISRKPRVLPLRKSTRKFYDDLTSDYINKRNKTFNLYAFFVLLDERRAGRMVTWEGIRIVKENI
ncbi:SUMF1/EgtB/PvdO family nonheme iron enzyme [Tolypothrix sp. VBCCA 56010]|uniref:SUMF1/EgtB/PvdO family nonheme iron enzyme n=1 Tax=Tolypothrix sp. VBCCA 56010 TaxID=3137731 RepID=UPI003D7E9A49